MILVQQQWKLNINQQPNANSYYFLFACLQTHALASTCIRRTQPIIQQIHSNIKPAVQYALFSVGEYVPGICL